MMAMMMASMVKGKFLLLWLRWWRRWRWRWRWQWLKESMFTVHSQSRPPLSHFSPTSLFTTSSPTSSLSASSFPSSPSLVYESLSSSSSLLGGGGRCAGCILCRSKKRGYGGWLGLVGGWDGVGGACNYSARHHFLHSMQCRIAFPGLQSESAQRWFIPQCEHCVVHNVYTNLLYFFCICKRWDIPTTTFLWSEVWGVQQKLWYGVNCCWRLLAFKLLFTRPIKQIVGAIEREHIANAPHVNCSNYEPRVFNPVSVQRTILHK